MNNRWNEIAYKCWNERKSGRQFDQEMFAKLIIDKCLQQCYNRGMNDELYEGQLQAAAYIEEYFGIQNEA